MHYFPSSSDYGYAQHDIAVLFVAGFGSSMIFGTFVGGMADQFGRRLFVIVYGLTYAASCFTKRTYCTGTSIDERILGRYDLSQICFEYCSLYPIGKQITNRFQALWNPHGRASLGWNCN